MRLILKYFYSSLLLFLAIFHLGAQNSPNILLLEEARNNFKQGEYERAYDIFNIIQGDLHFDILQPDILLKFAQSAIAVQDFEQAKEAIGKFIRLYPNHQLLSEVSYTNAKLLFLSQNYHRAIKSLDSYRQRFPNDLYIGSSYYLSGEAYLSIGDYQQAEAMFHRVVEDYPLSYRVDSARYALARIQLKQKEKELLDILRWNHQEYLNLAVRAPLDSLEDFVEIGAESDENNSLILQSKIKQLEKQVQKLENDHVNSDLQRRLLSANVAISDIKLKLSQELATLER